MSTIKEEYVEKWEKRLDDLQSTIDTKIVNDDKFFENADYYTVSLDKIIKNQERMSANVAIIADQLQIDIIEFN